MKVLDVFQLVLFPPLLLLAIAALAPGIFVLWLFGVFKEKS